MEGSPAQEQRAGSDRRATRGIGGRRRAPRRAEDRAKLLREMAALVIALCGGLAVIYLFFAALGAVDVTEAATASGIALGLGVVWLAAFAYRMRSRAAESAGPRGDRERRGF